MKNHVLSLLKSASQIHLSLSETTAIQLISFLEILQKWNRAYNLTAITDFQKMISYHVIDSLSIVPYVKGDRIVDVGSGAGLPGIPLAIFFPKKEFVLIDSVGKKTRFMNHVVRTLQLKNIEVTQSRAEEYSTEMRFDTMVARAVGSLDDLITISRHLLHAQGRLLAMKSTVAAETLPSHARVITLMVPGITSPRSLIIVEG